MSTQEPAGAELAAAVNLARIAHRWGAGEDCGLPGVEVCRNCHCVASEASRQRPCRGMRRMEPRAALAAVRAGKEQSA